MMIMKYIILVLCGLSAGALVSAGISALLTSIGVITRIAYHTKTNKRIRHYENCIILGAIIGNICVIYEPSMQLVNHTQIISFTLLVLIGICMGIFVGCLAMSLAEALDATSILFRRLRISKYLWMVLLAVAIGKFTGNLLYFFY